MVGCRPGGFGWGGLSTYNFSKISYCVIHLLITRLGYQAENEP